MLSNNEIEFFTRSKLSMEVLKELSKGEHMAKILAIKMHKPRESISRIFLNLHKLGLTECTKPDSSNFRPYRITMKGRRKLREYSEFVKSFN